MLASVLVDCDGLPVRIVFVLNRKVSNIVDRYNNFEEKIIRIYGIYRENEVYFKMCKSFLGLAQFRSYDACQHNVEKPRKQK